jgi:RNA polymerase sigma-70 factor (ECF subfamily)
VASEHDYERLFREAGPALGRAMYAVTGGRRHLAEDVIAEAFARAMEHRGVRDPLAWIYRTALCLATEELKRERRTSGELEIDLAEEPSEFRDLLRALRRLSPHQRAAVVLHYEADMPVREVSRLMGIAPATVRVHLHRARNRLRQLLAEGEHEHA